MMKKLFKLSFAAFMALTLVACVSKPTVETNNDGQNPVMNFIGVYGNNRCTIQVNPKGQDEADILVTWGSSASEHGEWHMSGKLDLDTLTVHYEDCVHKNVTFNEKGEIEKEELVYENGKGTFTFKDNGRTLTLTWDDEQEHIADGVEYVYAS